MLPSKYSILARVGYYSIRHHATSASSRPALNTLIPGKKIVNRILFDNDSRLTYKQVVKVMDEVYTNLSTPEKIQFTRKVDGNDLMIMKDVLKKIRSTTGTINKNLVDLENELVEQAAELGSNDAITMLAFETLSSDKSSKEDFKYAQELIANLTEIKHPLVFKMAGDLAFAKGLYEQASDYWSQFLKLESDTLLSSNVYAQLGIYYFTHLSPKPNLRRAKSCFEKSIYFGELDGLIIHSHYYLGQMHSITDPQLSKYHLEISASRGLKESFASLGFLEMNVFQNYFKSLQWFNLGVESSGDLACIFGVFDCQIKLQNFKEAFTTLTRLTNLKEQSLEFSQKPNLTKANRDMINSNLSLIKFFLDTRKDIIDVLPHKIA